MLSKEDTIVMQKFPNCMLEVTIGLQHMKKIEISYVNDNDAK